MNAKKAWSRISALVLSLCMVVSSLPTAALAANSSYSEITKQNAEQVREYAEAMQLENTMKDYSKGGFTWDTEEQTDSWRYFNGLMLDAFLMMGDTTYAKAFYDSNISADGTIKNYHIGELDSVEAARGLFDLLKSDSLTVEERTKYQNAIQYVYSQLAAQTTYLDCGDNFLHKQETSGRPTDGWTEYNIGLDGLYMALPFLVEYADALKDGRLDPVEEEVPADWDLTNPEDPAAGEVTTPEDPAAGEVTTPEDPAAGEETDPETPAAGEVTTPEDPAAGEETDPETPAAGEETDPETPAAGEETDPETPATGEETAPETPAAGEEAAPEASGDNGTVTIEAQNIQYASANSAEAAAIYEAVYDRLLWVSENMYDEATGLFHHGWNVSANKGNGHFWARGLGWYAMALVDITEMMPSSYREDLTAQIQKLFAGVMQYQDSSTGMWYNVVTCDSTLSGNILETSGSSMFAYAMMKAYCCGYVDDMVGSAGLAAFNGTVSNKLVGGSVAGIYLKSGVGNTDESYCHYEYMSDEAKGTGALIMAATWAEKAAKKLEASLEQPSAAVISDTATGVAVESATITAIAVNNVTFQPYVTSALGSLLQLGYQAYDIKPTGYTPGDTVTVRLPIPSGVNADDAVAYYVPADGAPELLAGIPTQDGKFLEFTTNHFSTYAVGAPQTVTEPPAGAVTGNVLVSGGGTTYELDTDGVDARAKYLIVNTDNSYALRNNSGKAASQSVTVSGNTATISGNESDCLWTFTKNGSSWNIINGSHYLALKKSNIFNTSSEKFTVTSKGNGFYTVNRDEYYLNYDGSWKRAKSEYSVLLYKQTTSEETEGAAIWFDVTPKNVKLIQGETETLEARVGYVGGEELMNGFEVSYTSGNGGVATVDSSGIITAVSTGTVNITAELTKVGGKGVQIASIPITVTVTEKPAFDPDHPYDGLKTADPNNRPVYPAAGAVRLDKTASADHFTDTGVTRVELSVAGISEKRGVDVVLVVDVSNSMAWSLENAAGDGTGDATKLPSVGQSTKLDNAMAAAKEFSDILLGDNTGADSDNSLSFVTFAGYDAENYNKSSGKNDEKNYVDSVMTVFTNVKDSKAAKTSFSGTSVTGTANGTNADYTLKVTNETGEELVNGRNRGDTNYDYAFYQAQQVVKNLQAQSGYADSGRETYIVFMTDGAPSHYNGNNFTKDTKRDKLPDQETIYTQYSGYSDADKWTKYITGTTNRYATDLYDLVNGNFYAIGFDLAHGGFGTYTADEATLTEVLANMAGGGNTIPVMTTSNADTLTAFYNKLANQIKYAGTYAKVTDTVDSEFTLQTTPFEVNGSKVNPTITVTIYDLYTAESAGGNANLIGTRVPNSGKDLETVTVTGGDTIKGKYFTYTKTGDVETFVWNIGDIADKEYVLSYDAYIKEEAQTDGLHYTNEEATLEYIDVNNCYENREFPIPSLSWDSAVTQVEYYLANDKGEPVNWDGKMVIPFPNRIRIGGTAAVQVPWNRTVTVNGFAYLASAGVNGYTMVDPTASYTVMTNAAGKGILETSGTGVQRVDQDGDLKSSTVAFGVKLGAELPPMGYSLTEKQAVIDFDKPMLIDVTTANNAPAGYKVTPVAFAAYSSGVNLSQQQVNTNSTIISGAYGTFSLEGDKVKYTPNAIVNTVDRVFVVNKIAQGSQSYYMYQTLTVIPATVVYYETELASLAPTGSSWKTDGTAGTDTDYQETGLVSVAQTYGYDSSYADDTSVYSNGSAYKVTLAQGATATTSFSFRGTGFDIISRTGPNQGMIQVEVKGTTTKKVIVLNKGVQELNQIPVVSVNGLTPGSYTVTITAYGKFTNASYPDLNRGGEFVFDAVRIYEPMEAASTDDQTVAKAAYVTHGEDDPQFNEVRAKLFENGSYGGDYNVSYVDSNDTASFADYQEKGPNNEVYLAKGQSIAFTVSRGDLSSFDIGAKTVNGTAATMRVSIDKSSTETVVTSGTALYYAQDASVVRSGSTVVITNTGEGLLSITDIKTTVSSLSASSLRFSAGPTTVAKAEDILVWNKIKTALGKEAAAE